MPEKLPFLIIIPHGGLDIPEELYGYENVSPLNIFFEPVMIDGTKNTKGLYPVLYLLFFIAKCVQCNGVGGNDSTVPVNFKNGLGQ